MRTLVRAFALALVACTSANVEEDGARARASIVRGTPAPTDDAVVAFVARRATCTAAASPDCTGVLVAPDAVLTAAHCFDRRGGDDTEVVVSAVVDASASFRRIAKVIVHPAYDASTGAHDLAVVRLAHALATPPIARGALDASIVGSSARVVGYGSDELARVGTRLTGTTTIDAIDATSVHYVPDPSMTCVGDSGGPVLVTQGGVERVVAITRAGDDACAAYGDAVRLDAERAFVDDALAADATSAPAQPIDFCGASCAGDADCPAGMHCLSERAAGMHCGYLALRSGDFGADCTRDDACASGTCAALGAGEDRLCRCFAPCATSTSTPAPTPSAGNVGGGGCDVAARPRSSSSLAAWAILLAALARRLRSV